MARFGWMKELPQPQQLLSADFAKLDEIARVTEAENSEIRGGRSVFSL
jgi:hypothetical protein